MNCPDCKKPMNVEVYQLRSGTYETYSCKNVTCDYVDVTLDEAQHKALDEAGREAYREMNRKMRRDVAALRNVQAVR